MINCNLFKLEKIMPSFLKNQWSNCKSKNDTSASPGIDKARGLAARIKEAAQVRQMNQRSNNVLYNCLYYLNSKVYHWGSIPIAFAL